MQTTLTSTETAALLDVHPSTIKRWCNGGDLASELTAGGHRRIRIDAAVDFARGRNIRTVLTPFHPFEPHVWAALKDVETEGDFTELHALGLQWARRGDLERLEQLFLALGRSERVTFCEYCDSVVRGLLHAVGEEWQAGRMRVGDEHMVSQAVTGALLALRREWLDRRAGNGRARGPVAVVGTMEGNHHQIGALCVRMLLERLGWEVYYPGADVPIEDFGVIQMSREAVLVCISLPPSATAGDVLRSVTILRELYDRGRPYSLAFGGSSTLDTGRVLDDTPFVSVAHFTACAGLREAVEGGFGAEPGGHDRG